MADPFLDDLLKHTGPGRAQGIVGRLALLVALVGLGGGLYWTFVLERTAERAEAPAVAIAQAMAKMDHAVQAARLPLTVDPEASEAAQAAQSGSLLPSWREGQEVGLKGALQKNESAFAALQARGLDNKKIQKALGALGKIYNFRTSRPGDQWFAQVSAQGVIENFRYQSSREDIWEAAIRGDGSYKVHKVELPIERREVAVAGRVATSLWGSMEAAGLSASVAAKYIDTLGSLVKFDEVSRPGDAFALVYEKLYLEGEELRDGKVLGARYEPQSGKPHEVYFFDHDDASTGYYLPSGKSVQREFLKSPLGNVRITSTFGRRFHPVLKRWKMHSGVDYGAPTGTPIRALAPGVVKFAAWKGPNGKLVTIRHKNGMTSHYAHLSVIPKGIKPGAKVTRSTIIGRVGSTGRSTGPHLHLGLKRGGRYIDPLGTSMMRSPPLKGAPKRAFAAEVVARLGPKLELALGKVSATPAEDQESVFAPPQALAP